MAYRNGTYIAFHANGNSEPTESDMKYYNLLKAWHVRSDNQFSMINSHDKTGAVRDSSKRATLRVSLRKRLRNSKNMILIIGKTTKYDVDWIPFEIGCAIDDCAIPIIAAYTGYECILAPDQLFFLWPNALTTRIQSGSAHVMHVPFKQAPLTDAVDRFSHAKYPNGGGYGFYSRETYQTWGLLKPS